MDIPNIQHLLMLLLNVENHCSIFPQFTAKSDANIRLHRGHNTGEGGVAEPWPMHRHGNASMRLSCSAWTWLSKSLLKWCHHLIHYPTCAIFLCIQTLATKCSSMK